MRTTLLVALMTPQHEEYRQDAYATLFLAMFKIIIENTFSWQPLHPSVATSKQANFATFSGWICASDRMSFITKVSITG